MFEFTIFLWKFLWKMSNATHNTLADMEIVSRIHQVFDLFSLTLLAVNPIFSIHLLRHDDVQNSLDPQGAIQSGFLS